MTIDPITVTADAVDEAKTYVRIENDDEDSLIAALLASAIRHAENYTGHVLITRGVTERIAASSAWQRLSASPVQSITGVSAVPPVGAAVLLAIDAYAIDIDTRGDGWLRISQPTATPIVTIAYTAGAAAQWSQIPDPLRHAVLRTVGYLHANRDSDTALSPAIAALLRPWRRLVLS